MAAVTLQMSTGKVISRIEKTAKDPSWFWVSVSTVWLLLQDKWEPRSVYTLPIKCDYTSKSYLVGIRVNEIISNPFRTLAYKVLTTEQVAWSTVTWIQCVFQYIICLILAVKKMAGVNQDRPYISSTRWSS